MTAKGPGEPLCKELEKLINITSDPETQKLLASSESASRETLMAAGGLYSSALMFDHAVTTGRKADMELVDRYVEQGVDEWTAVPQRIKSGYYSLDSYNKLREAVFANHNKSN